MQKFLFGKRRQPEVDEQGMGISALRMPNAQKTAEPDVGFGMVIGDEQVKEAEEILRKYRDGKASLEKRVIENEKWFRLLQWEVIGHSKNKGDPEPKSGWLFNSIINKHADAMDNTPTLAVLPREQADEMDAQALSSILPSVLEQCDYEEVYDNMWWRKLKSGTGVTGVFWDAEKLNGLGDIDIRTVDILNLFWEPGVRDIQNSRHLFHVELRSLEEMQEMYPQLKDGAKLKGGNTITLAQYAHDDTLDTTDKCTVIDWYYKLRNPDGVTVLHYCKFAEGHVLYASQNDPEYAERGYYDHGRYPFEFDTMFPLEDSPAGFGYIDIMKSPQIFIDKLEQAILKNTVIGARPRYWKRRDAEVNVQQYADLSQDFVDFSGSGDPNNSIFPINIPPLNTAAITMREMKVAELKETSGNRDFSQGGTTSGITAASAIASLQEAGSKLSRDMIKASYRAFAQVGYLCIELIRQFYTEPRMFRIIGENGAMQFVEFSGQKIAAKQTGDGFMESTRLPVFDIKVQAQKASPFSTIAQNERAKELYQLGFFRPDNADQSMMALEMMQFEGIETLKQKISQNGTMFQKMQQLTPLVMAIAQELDQVKGTQYAPQIAQILAGGNGMGQMMAAPQPSRAISDEPETNSLGDTVNKTRNSTAGEARKRAAESATPR